MQFQIDFNGAGTHTVSVLRLCSTVKSEMNVRTGLEIRIVRLST